jgi:hypothetical protein
MMRTTLTIDDDLAAQIEELRRRKGLSMKNAVNILLREGLRQQLEPLQPKRFRTQTHKLGLRPGFDPTKLNQLADELEAEVFQEKLIGSQR